jgi:dTDP-4-amino-4,6-dideoxygalactose transaminase
MKTAVVEELEPIQLPSDADSSGRTFGPEEVEELRRVIASGTLNCTRGRTVIAFENAFAALIGVPHARAVTSGTAAIHTAIAALDLEPGDEVVTTSITDMGAIAPILYQAAIPVFADVDPDTCNVTAESIAARITRRTRAVIVTHLFGNPCEMDEILALCAERGLPVVEDAAQAYLATYQGRFVGSLGAIGCFSLQQGKHLSSGEGGIVVTSDPALYRRIKLFSDKAWGYGDPQPDHYFLALNYRMTELQGGVALAQVEKLPGNVEHRVAMAERLTKQIAGIDGVHAPLRSAHSRHVYWRYALRIDSGVFEGGLDAFATRLKCAGIFTAPRYIQKPAFECAVLRDRNTFGTSQFPFVGEHRNGEPPIVYDREQTPGTIEALSKVLVLPWNEKFEESHVDYIAHAIRSAAEELAL